MGIFRLNCPWCGSTNSAFDIRSERIWDQANHFYRQFTAECGGCHNWVLIDAEVEFNFRGEAFEQANHTIRKDVFPKFRMWPPEPSTDAPESTPDRPAKAFTQALKALHRQDWDAAGMTARKSLELATGILDPTFTRDDGLKARIRRLGEAHKITPQLVEWADAIREDGNDAAHDDFTEEEAKQICEFAKTFLEYVFTMPGKLAVRKAEFDHPDPSADA